MSNAVGKDYDELTLRELILTIQDYLRFFLSKWYWFLLGSGCLAGYLLYAARETPTVYAAPLTFSLEGGGGGQLIGGSILGQLGLGGSSEGGVSYKLLELARTRKVVTPVLFDSISINGDDDFLANHIIRAYKLQQQWSDSETLSDFLFSGVPTEADRTANRVLKILHRMIANLESDESLFRISVNEQTGIFSMNVRTVNDELSLALIKGLFSSLQSFHVTASSRQKIETLTLLTQRADSVEVLLKAAEGEYAREQDRSSRITLRQNTLREQRLSREILILSTMYAEVLKNKETASFLLSSEKPSFIIIDEPLMPLRAVKSSLTWAAVYGVIGGALLVAFVLFFIKLIRTAMAEEPENLGNV